MTDAVKRRELSELESNRTPSVHSRILWVFLFLPLLKYKIQYAGHIPLYEAGSYVAPGVKPTPLPTHDFPEAISSLAQWGTTIRACAIAIW